MYIYRVVDTYIGSFILVLEVLGDERGALYGVQDVIRVCRSRRRSSSGLRFSLPYRHTAADRQRRLPPRSAGSNLIRRRVVVSPRARRRQRATVFTSGPRHADVVDHLEAAVESVVAGDTALGGQGGSEDTLLGGVRSTHHQQPGQDVEKDFTNPRSHRVSRRRAKVNVEHNDCDNDGQCNKDHCKEQVLANERDNQRRGWDDLG